MPEVLPDTLSAGPVGLHRLTVDHADPLVDAMLGSLTELHRWFFWAQSAPTVEDQRQRLANAERAFAAGRDFEFGLIEGATHKLVGALRLDPSVRVGTAGIGYWVRSDRHRRGYASAATRAATSAAFEHLPSIDLVEIQMDRANEASVGIPRKLGYALDREVDRRRLAPGQTGRGFVWVMTQDRW